jgi:hypothetical protein
MAKDLIKKKACASPSLGVDIWPDILYLGRIIRPQGNLAKDLEVPECSSPSTWGGYLARKAGLSDGNMP